MSAATPPVRVLIVDDDRLLRLLVARTLEAAGCVVEEGDSGAAALRLAQTLPDVVVIDVNLPDLSGLAVCRALRAAERTADVGLVVVTAAEDNRTIVSALDAGADDCLRKPVDAEILIARVRRAVAHAGERRAARAARERLARATAVLDEAVTPAEVLRRLRPLLR